MPIETFFTYHLKAHTISNKLVSEVFAQKKGETSYDSYKYVFRFRWFQVGPTLNMPGNQYVGGACIVKIIRTGTNQRVYVSG